MKKFFWYTGLVGVYFLAFLYEYLAFSYGWYFIEVSNEYINCIYTAQVTLAVLSISILTLFTSILKDEYFGFSYKDIIINSNELLNYYSFSLICFANIFLITISYTFGLVNTTSFLLFFTLLVIVIYLMRAINLLISITVPFERIKEFVEKAINKKDIKKIEKFLNNLVNHFENCVDKLIEKDEMQSILSTISRISSNVGWNSEIVKNLLERYKVIFPKYCSEKGYKVAIDYFSILLQDDTIWKYEKAKIYGTILENLKFYNESEVLQINIVSSLNNFYFIESLDKKTLSYILYNYFIAIYENVQISAGFKKKTMDKFLENVTSFSSNKTDHNKEMNDMQERLVIEIFIDIAIMQQDEYVFLTLLKFLELNEWKNDEMTSIIYAYILLGLYSYGFCETELLKESFREKIRAYINKATNEIDCTDVSFKFLLEKHSNEIAKSFANIIFEEGYNNLFEYHTQGISVKTLVWTDIFKQKIFLFLTLVNTNKNPMSYLETALLEMSDEIKQRFLSNYFELFTLKDNVPILKVGVIEEFNLFCEWIGENSDSIKDTYYNSIIKAEYRVINEEITKLNNAKAEKHINSYKFYNEDSINQAFEEYFCEELFGYDKTLEFTETSIKLSSECEVNNTEYVNNKVMAKIFRNYVEHYVSTNFSEKTIKLRISFNLEGVKVLLAKLKENVDIDIITTIFHRDWAISPDVRETDEYKELSEVESVDKYKNISFLNNCYINSKKFSFRARIFNLVKRELNDEELERYCENYRVSGGMYNADGAFLNRTDAISFFKKSRIVTRFDFEFESNFSNESGFSLEYDLSNK